MKALAISYKGMEDITALEIKELLKAKTEIKKSCVLFDIKKLEELALLCYRGQAVNRVLLLLDNFKISKIEDLKRIGGIDFSEWLKDRTFAARCEIVENEELSSKEIEKATGDEIEGKVNLDNPDITVFVYIHKNDCYVGIDFGGDLGKRSYKIFTQRFDLKGTIAYSLVRLAGYKGKGIILDPFCRNGTIAIEAALFGSGLSVNYFNKKFPFLKFLEIDLGKFDKKIKETKIFGFDDQLGYIKSAQKNSKIAGVDKQISFSKLDIGWLDIKFKKDEVNFIVSNAPRATRYSKPEKEYKEFFHQAKFVLKKTGKIIVCCNKTELLKGYAGEDGFKVVEERDIVHGKEVLKTVMFKKL